MDKLDYEIPGVIDLPLLKTPEKETPEFTEVGQVCLAAAEYLVLHGWRRNAPGKDGGRRCLVGALYSALLMDEDYVTQYSERALIAKDLYKNAISKIHDKLVEVEAFDSLPHWNDTRAENRDEVISLLLQCAEDERR